MAAFLLQSQRGSAGQRVIATEGTGKKPVGRSGRTVELDIFDAMDEVRKPFTAREPFQKEMERLTLLRKTAPAYVGELMTQGRLINRLAGEGDLRKIREIVRNSADSELLQWWVQKAFVTALQHMHVHVLSYLIRGGLDIFARPYANPHVRFALFTLMETVRSDGSMEDRSGSKEALTMLRYLAKGDRRKSSEGEYFEGFDVDEQRRPIWQSPLTLACFYACEAAVKVLVCEAGANVNSVAKDDLMPLHFAQGVNTDDKTPIPGSKYPLLDVNRNFDTTKAEAAGHVDVCVMARRQRIAQLLLARKARKSWRMQPIKPQSSSLFDDEDDSSSDDGGFTFSTGGSWGGNLNERKDKKKKKKKKGSNAKDVQDPASTSEGRFTSVFHSCKGKKKNQKPTMVEFNEDTTSMGVPNGSKKATTNTKGKASYKGGRPTANAGSYDEEGKLKMWGNTTSGQNKYATASGGPKYATASGGPKYATASGGPKYATATGGPKYATATGGPKYSSASGGGGEMEGATITDVEITLQNIDINDKRTKTKRVVTSASGSKNRFGLSLSSSSSGSSSCSSGSGTNNNNDMTEEREPRAKAKVQAAEAEAEEFVTFTAPNGAQVMVPKSLAMRCTVKPDADSSGTTTNTAKAEVPTVNKMVSSNSSSSTLSVGGDQSVSF